MNAGKTTSLLQAAYNYNERGRKTIMLSPVIDTRDGVGTIKSRIGLSSDAIKVGAEDNVFELVTKELNAILDSDLTRVSREFGAVFVDEAQFLSKEQVDQLTDVADYLNVPVMTYGLRTDAFGNLFPGSERLLAVADSLKELKTICKCGKKANFVVRYDDHGNVAKGGSQVEIGGNSKYVSMCRKHWKEAMSD